MLSGQQGGIVPKKIDLDELKTFVFTSDQNLATKIFRPRLDSQCLQTGRDGCGAGSVSIDTLNAKRKAIRSLMIERRLCSDSQRTESRRQLGDGTRSFRFHG
jgi:hypothetical protein